MCEYALDQWRRRAELESFNNSILKEIEEARLRLERRIVDLRIQGNFHEVAKCEKLVALLNRTEESMRRMVNNQGS
jgi:hypothetical protein